MLSSDDNFWLDNNEQVYEKSYDGKIRLDSFKIVISNG
jgi:hypothetical protein